VANTDEKPILPRKSGKRWIIALTAVVLIVGIPSYYLYGVYHHLQRLTAVRSLLLRGDRAPFFPDLERDVRAMEDKYGVSEATVVETMTAYAPDTKLKYAEVRALTEKTLSSRKH